MCVCVCVCLCRRRDPCPCVCVCVQVTVIATVLGLVACLSLLIFLVVLCEARNSDFLAKVRPLPHTASPPPPPRVCDCVTVCDCVCAGGVPSHPVREHPDGVLHWGSGQAAIRVLG